MIKKQPCLQLCCIVFRCGVCLVDSTSKSKITVLNYLIIFILLSGSCDALIRSKLLIWLWSNSSWIFFVFKLENVGRMFKNYDLLEKKTYFRVIRYIYYTYGVKLYIIIYPLRIIKRVFIIILYNYFISYITTDTQVVDIIYDTIKLYAKQFNSY